MKKILTLFMAFAAMCCIACSDDDDNTDNSPIKGLELPPSTTPVTPGSSITIKGEGFTKASEIWFRTIAARAEGGGDVKATVTEVNLTGITLTAPMVFGNQSVLLKENGKEYELGRMTFEEQPEGGQDVVILSKKVAKIIFVVGKETDTLLFSYNADGKIISMDSRKARYTSLTKYQYENNRIVETAESKTGSFELKDGKANTIKSKHIGYDGSEEYTLSYNSSGYLETVEGKWYEGGKLDSEETGTFTFTNGYMIGYAYQENGPYHGEYTFEYGDFKHINNVNIDLWGVIGGETIFYTEIANAFMLGVTGNRHKYMPTKVKISEIGKNEDGQYITYTLENTLEYVLNDEGYVTNVNIKSTDGTDWRLKIYYEQ